MSIVKSVDPSSEESRANTSAYSQTKLLRHFISSPTRLLSSTCQPSFNHRHRKQLYIGGGGGGGAELLEVAC